MSIASNKVYRTNHQISEGNAVMWQDMAASAHREAVVAVSCQYNRTAVGRQNEAARFARRARAQMFDLLGSEPE